jgi:hypothetical protein
MVCPRKMCLFSSITCGEKNGQNSILTCKYESEANLGRVLLHFGAASKFSNGLNNANSDHLLLTCLDVNPKNVTHSNLGNNEMKHAGLQQSSSQTMQQTRFSTLYCFVLVCSFLCGAVERIFICSEGVVVGGCEDQPTPPAPTIDQD